MGISDVEFSECAVKANDSGCHINAKVCRPDDGEYCRVLVIAKVDNSGEGSYYT